ncbi:hypothetical protein WJM97_15120 [Okeanomitos corallinicola TIOX110]|uniref:Uncharacterized protein n=1 Tax=Okeanomitos corallinicola TIOX110 TaxID=3133117 RepID=A0ABZ2UMW1_9CYAN
MSQQTTDNTGKILDSAEKIVDNITESEIVELSEVAAKTTENIFTILVSSGGKPVAIILAIAILVATFAIPLSVIKIEPSPINLPATTSQVKQLE